MVAVKKRPEGYLARYTIYSESYAAFIIRRLEESGIKVGKVERSGHFHLWQCFPSTIILTEKGYFSLASQVTKTSELSKITRPS